MSAQAVALSILLFPAAGALVLAGRGWRLPRIATQSVGPGVVWLSFIATLWLLFNQVKGDFAYWTWIKSGVCDQGGGGALAARKAFVMKVIGDVGMIRGSCGRFVSDHAGTFAGVFQAVHSDDSMLELAAFLLLVGAVAKSAQIPLRAWLP